MNSANLSSQTDPVPEFQVPDSTPLRPQHNLIAPLWHTIVIVVLILLNSYAGRPSQGMSGINAQGRFLLYGFTFVVQLVLVLFIWYGIRRRGVRMQDLIGGRWAKPEDFLIDVGIAMGFWLVSTLLRALLGIALHLIDIRNPRAQATQMKQALGPIIPQSTAELVLFLILVVFAGFFEEIIFRGYLQRQFGALTRNAWIGVVISAALFGAGHGYQGARMMVLIGIYGAMFGVLAVLRKNLRPGMMAHAGQDAFSGIFLFFLIKKGLF